MTRTLWRRYNEGEIPELHSQTEAPLGLGKYLPDRKVQDQRASYIEVHIQPVCYRHRYDNSLLHLHRRWCKCRSFFYRMLVLFPEAGVSDPYSCQELMYRTRPHPIQVRLDTCLSRGRTPPNVPPVRCFFHARLRRQDHFRCKMRRILSMVQIWEGVGVYQGLCVDEGLSASVD